MKSTAEHIEAHRRGEQDAFTALVTSHQNLALGYAFSLLGEFHRAQDVVQEAFVIVHAQLDRLEKPEAFPGWLRGIVHNRCMRVFRGSKGVKLVDVAEVRGQLGAPDTVHRDLQRLQERRHVVKAIKALPEHQRAVITLYYLEERSQKAVAAFLEIPLSTVNNHLHAARQQLKERLVNMAPDTFKDRRLSEEFARNIGEIVKVRGSIVEARTRTGRSTRVLDVVGTKHAETNTHEADLVVVQRLSDGRFRSISTGGTPTMRSGLHATDADTREQAHRGLGEAQIREAVATIRSKRQDMRLETGIKAIDLFCPLTAGCTMGIFGKEGVGRAVFMMEVLHRRKSLGGALSAFFYVPLWTVLGTQDMLETEPLFAADLNDNVDTAWIVHPRGGDPSYAKEATYLDARLYFSPIKAAMGLWPAFDPLHSHSSALTEERVGPRHFRVAHEALNTLQEARDLMRDAVYLELLALGQVADARKRLEAYRIQHLTSLSLQERQVVLRAERLEAYFTQPFYVAEKVMMKKPGESVPLNTTIADVERILAGELDEHPVESLMWLGGL